VTGIDGWQAAANLRIEAIRKRDARLRFVDRTGRPVRGLPVEVRQIRHRFAFGAAVNHTLLEDPEYADFFFRHFEWGVLENESKWRYNEPTQGNVTYEDADAMLALCENRGIPMRGHLVFWDVWHKVPYWARDLPDEELSDAMEARIGSVVPHFAGRFRHWDVDNEILTGGYYEERFGPGIHAWMYQRTRELDPDVRLFLNEFGVLKGGDTDPLLQLVASLRAQGAPLDGIGLQGHFNPVVDARAVKSTLDRVATAELPIWITEYDSPQPDETLRADNLEALYRMAFSHPAVEGILMWGFWAGNHWRGPDAAIVDLDWTLNEAGVRYVELLDEWTTRADGRTDRVGELAFRGFHGTYRVTVRDPSWTAEPVTFELEPGAGEARMTVEVEAADPVLLPWTPPDPGIFPGDPGPTLPGDPSPGVAGPLAGP
jgi:GH35 family endo-1,4-beta-xylanase